jgi:hypothetical protein
MMPAKVAVTTHHTRDRIGRGAYDARARPYLARQRRTVVREESYNAFGLLNTVH